MDPDLTRFGNVCAYLRRPGTVWSELPDLLGKAMTNRSECQASNINSFVPFRRRVLLDCFLVDSLAAIGHNPRHSDGFCSGENYYVPERRRKISFGQPDGEIRPYERSRRVFPAKKFRVHFRPPGAQPKSECEARNADSFFQHFRLSSQLSAFYFLLLYLTPPTANSY